MAPVNAALAIAAALAAFCGVAAWPRKSAADAPPRGPLDPRGRLHVPIGAADSLDALKTFVEPEGCFSPGFATYGIYFWIYDVDSRTLTAPTIDGVRCEHGLAAGGRLIPWSQWKAGNLVVRTEVCQVLRDADGRQFHVAAARASITNTGLQPATVRLYVAVRSLGPAGGPIARISVADEGDAVLVDDKPVLVSNENPSSAGVAQADTVGQAAAEGLTPQARVAESPSGDASGALVFDATIGPGHSRRFGFICPVLAGRRAVAHQWDGTSQWAQFDLARPNPPEGGVLQPLLPLDDYRRLKADALFAEAEAYWKDLAGRAAIRTPDGRWSDAFAAILSHAALAMNEGAPDVAVVNYNVFNRDGVYTANMLQKAGRADLAEKAIDYFRAHPFNGRVYPEADNPGQVLWVMGEHWLITRDKAWLRRVYGDVAKLAAMITYYRTTPGPHWVAMDGIAFGDAVPREKRHQLKPGQCDGSHPEYTEAFDVAGLWRAALMAQALENQNDAARWSALADSLLAAYDARFGDDLGKGYGSYCVLWPLRLYPLDEGKALERFRKTGPQKPGGWRYFPLATAHQGLIAGNREAACGTIAAHLDHEQMRGWYVLDEGGKSGAGGWPHARTTWNPSVAMPHGWAIAEFWLLLRDALVFEDGDRLVLLAGVPVDWFAAGEPIAVDRLPTYFGLCSYAYEPMPGGARITLGGDAAPADGYVLRLPAALRPSVKAAGKTLRPTASGDFVLPTGTKLAEIAYASPH